MLATSSRAGAAPASAGRHSHGSTAFSTPREVAGKPSIVKQPQNITSTAGSIARVSVIVTGAPLPSIQWWEKSAIGPWQAIPGAEHTTYSVRASAALSGLHLRVVVASAEGTVVSKTVSLTLVSAPVVVTQPSNTSAPIGGAAVLQATATGNPTPKVQWYSETATSAWTAIPKATKNTLIVIGAQSASATSYEAVFTNATGTAASNSASVSGYFPMTNWSGYEAPSTSASGEFTAVSATWVVPTVTCGPGATTSAVEWVGIDGFANSTVEQDGTETSCSDGVPTYGAWWEMFGDDALNGGHQVPILANVLPGDVINASVTVTAGTWTLTVNDETQGWTSANVVTDPISDPTQATAEVIVERPQTCLGSACTLTTIAEISPVTFTNISITTAVPETLLAANPMALVLLDPSGVVLTPATIEPGGTSFTVTEAITPTTAS
jgi:hypothetical protein